MRLWNRYLLKEFFTFFGLTLCSFYLIYILLDYSSHPSRFYFSGHFQWQQLGLYYLCEFLRRLSSLAPFALLVSSIYVLTKFTQNNELLAMMASGVTIKKLIQPLVLVALVMTSFLYVNAEFFAPPAFITLNRINDAHKYEKKSYRERPTVQQLSLKDDSTMLFQKFDSSRNTFHDIYWVRSIDNVYHMKTLNFQSKVPTATFTDHFQRDSQGELILKDSFPLKTFPEIHLSKHFLREIAASPEDQPLSKLWKKRPKTNKALSDKEAQVLAAFSNKLVLPWLCLFAIIAPAPFCISHKRQYPTFMIYACSLFALVAFFIILNSALALGKRQVLDPLLSTWIPFTMILGASLWRYSKL